MTNEAFREAFSSLVPIFYFVTVLLFIFGLKLLQSPKTARRGNLLSSIGMLIAIAATLLDQGIVSYDIVLIVFAIGAVIGVILAYTVDLRSIPQFVAVLNGFGGAVSAVVGVAEFLLFQREGHIPAGVNPGQFFTAVGADVFIGTLTFWGSMIAFAKLQGIISEKSFVLPGKNVFNSLFLLAAIILIVLLVNFSTNTANSGGDTILWLLIGIIVAATLLGLTLTMAVGGADMPIVISLFISYAGLSASALGFTNLNYGLIMVGSLVGASGLILTRVMAKAINRNFWGILLGNITPPAATTTGGDDIYAGKVKSTNAEEVASLLKIAERVVIVPGYGMAVGRAVTPVRQLFEAMEANGTTVEFGIHPVAGRMPGHMNVLLAEESIPYDKLKEMEVVNGTFSSTDVVIVIGANDVVNPLARDSSGTPISGMPILDVDQARTVVVVKRSLAPGFAGIANPLFAADNSLMLFADAKKGMEEVLAAYKAD